jgi:gamma-glutamyl:cysteine ligase YbdK (ATP-grasp superfamily)
MAKKLTYYSPFMVPFSFSSPFYDGTLWDGLSVRTYIRTGRRMAALAFVNDDSLVSTVSPPIARKARSSEEHGRIEFKAFDTPPNFEYYAALCALLKGMALDTSLKERSSIPAIDAHQLSAKKGFHDVDIYKGARRVLEAAHIALRGDDDENLLKKLDDTLLARLSPAQLLIDTFQERKSIQDTLWFYRY